METYAFGTLPSGAARSGRKEIEKGESSKHSRISTRSANGSGASKKHKSSWTNLYHKLLGSPDISPVRGSSNRSNGPGDSEEEFVRWDHSSSPIHSKPKADPDTSSPGIPKITPGKATESGDTKVGADPATVLLSKFNPGDSLPLSTWPLRQTSASQDETPQKAKKSESALATIVPCKVENRGFIGHTLPQLYSPGYLKRSISFDRATRSRKKSKGQGYYSLPLNENNSTKSGRSHVFELLTLADNITDQQDSDVQGARTAPSSPTRDPDLAAESNDPLDKSSPLGCIAGGSPRPKLSSSPLKSKTSMEHHLMASDHDTDDEAEDDGWDMDELDKLILQRENSLGPSSGKVTCVSPSRKPFQEKSVNSLAESQSPTKPLGYVKPGKSPPKLTRSPIKTQFLHSAKSTSPVKSKSLPISLSDFEDESSSDVDFDLQELDKQIQSRQQQTQSMIDIKTITKSFRQQTLIDQPLTTTITRPDCFRLLVTNIEETPTEAILTVTSDNTPYQKVILQHSWCHDHFLEIGDIVNVILGGPEQKDIDGDTIVINNKQNLMVSNPDLLLTATAVSDSVTCRRRAVLRERIRGIAGSYSKFMLFGSIVHELFQDCLTTNDFSSSYLTKRLNSLVCEEYLEQIVLVGLTAKSAIDEIESSYLANFGEWKRNHFSGPPTQFSSVDDHRGSGSKPLISITKVVDIEQEIWSPVFGLKGKIDATVEAHLKDATIDDKFIVPFELKTSRSMQTIAHRAQTVLYTLLLSERYDVKDTPFGVLCYIVMGRMLRVPVMWDEIRALLIARNRLAAYSKHSIRQGYEGTFDTEALPEPIGDEFACKRCDWREICMVSHYFQGGNAPDTSGVPELFEVETKHLTTAHAQFYNHWSRLLGIEGSTLNMYRKHIWTMTSKDREALGACWGQMQIDQLLAEIKLSADSAAGNNKRFSYILSAKNGRQLRYVESQIHAGDHIVVSDELGHVYLGSGLLVSANSHSIVIDVNRQLKADVLYRIDRDELFAGMSLARANLAQLFVNSGDARRRDFIVDLKQPRFLSTPPHYRLENKDEFNLDQKRAIDKCLRAEDYTLVLGMPGTGKTTTIAALIDILVKQHQKTVLIASHTHSAVDNILLKLKGRGMGILRLGAARKIHPDIHEFLPNSNITTEEELDRAYMEPPIVATTCMAINDWVFAKRIFDYCIVDEASQITLPSCIGPLRMADKFILVGDHYQLPPLVKHPKALDGGLDVSLFKHLCTAHPGAVASLEHQYRMCEDIMLLSNKLIYDGRLKCGTKEVGEQSLVLKNPHGFDKFKNADLDEQTDWIAHVLRGDSKVVFLNTDELPGWETTIGDRVQNETEALVAKIIIDALTSCGILQSSIGVISQYRAQIRLLGEKLAYHRSCGLEILTADRSQGRDKECVIVSLVRSNQSGSVGELLQDWRRLNVSFTRAKSKLVIIGSSKTLESARALNEFLKIIESKHWAYSIPVGGLAMYESVPEPTAIPVNVKKINANYNKILSQRPFLREIMNETIPSSG